MWGLSPVIGFVVVGAAVAVIAALLLFEPHVRRLGVELRLWSASYLVYLLLVFFPQSSIFRLLVPLSPLWGAFALPRSTAWRSGCAGGGPRAAVVVDLQHVRTREYRLADPVTPSSVSETRELSTPVPHGLSPVVGAR